MSAEQKNPENQPDQGRASFTTGSASQGGSNFGQGSSHLGGESYQQGSVGNRGTDQGNETDRLGSSSVGTSNEGSSSPLKGNGNTSGAAQQSAGWNNDEERNDTRRGQMEDDQESGRPQEGDRRDTSLESASGLGDDSRSGDEVRKSEERNSQSGWSAGTTGE